MHQEDAPAISGIVMRALVQIMAHSAGKAGGVMEDALMAMSVLIEGNILFFVRVVPTWKCSVIVMGQSFAQYMEVFKPFLVLGLKNHAEYQVIFASLPNVGQMVIDLL